MPIITVDRVIMGRQVTLFYGCTNDRHGDISAPMLGRPIPVNPGPAPEPMSTERTN